MTLTRRARELMIVAMLLALPILFLRANVKAPSELNFLDRIILRISSPIEAVLTGAARGIGGAWHRYVALIHTGEKNDALVEEIARLKSENERLRQEAARGVELEALLELRGSLPIATVAATIIGAETSAFFRVVRVKLDRGEADVKPGMPVISSAGVVGRIQRVYGSYSEVLLAVDPKSAIDIVAPRTGGRGVLKGIPGDNRYRTRIEYLLRKDEIAEGDKVVTSGLGAFPRDLVVGKVVKVVKRDFGLYQEAEVEPVVDFAKLSQVLIVLSETGKAP